MKAHASVAAQPLPFPINGLRDYGIAPEEVADHYNKHHCHYASALEKLVESDSSLCSIVDQHDFRRRKMNLVMRNKNKKKEKDIIQKKGNKDDDSVLSPSPLSRSERESGGSEATTTAASSFPSSTPLTSAEALMINVPRDSPAGNLASMVVNHDFFWRCWRGSGSSGEGEEEAPHRCGHSSENQANSKVEEGTKQRFASAPVCLSSASQFSSLSQTVVVGPETTSFSLRHKHPTLSALLQFVERDFGSVKSLQRTFEKAAFSLFGSGWVWLAWSRERSQLVVLVTRDSVNPLTIVPSSPLLVVGERKSAAAATPFTHGDVIKKAGFVPIIGCDMWEHAYLVHGAACPSSSSSVATLPSFISGAEKEKRNYLRKFWSGANWEFAASNFGELVFVGGVNAPTSSPEPAAQALTKIGSSINGSNRPATPASPRDEKPAAPPSSPAGNKSISRL